MNIDEAVDKLNEFLKLDRKAITLLCLGLHTFCNEKLAEHPTVQVKVEQRVDDGEKYFLGLLGILNGLFSDDKYFIEAKYAVALIDGGAISVKEFVKVKRDDNG